MSTSQQLSPGLSECSASSDSPPASAISAATTKSSTSAVSASSSSSSVTDLPASAYDGSHLHWKAFRQHVLAPHQIRVLETPPKGQLPDSFLAIVEARSRNTERFSSQKTCFREQVSEGRGFGPSPLFPPNLLPSIDDQPRLARCMMPQFQRDALPLRTANHTGPLYELSVPRPGLGCGFSSLAFSDQETNILPSCLVGTGTSVDFSTGYISPSHAVYCPFLIFERAYGRKEHRLEAANNQCAIGGAYCCRSLQMLYSKAYAKESAKPRPVAFSCTVDNDFAIINYHWIDADQTYHMAPLCKFDLQQDDHFNHFAAWVVAIGEWALANVLPQIRRALSAIVQAEKPSPSFVEMKAVQKFATATSESNKNDMLIKSLKMTFDNIPWRFEDDEFTPVSSATAAWGSPVVDDMLISSLAYPSLPRVNSLPTSFEDIPTQNRLNMADLRLSPGLSAAQSPPAPAYNYNSELGAHKRLDHAMDEIRELNVQLETMKRSKNDFDIEMAGIRNTLATILRKESTLVRTRSLLARRVSSPADLVPSSPTDADMVFPRPQSSPLMRSRRPNMPNIRTDLAPLPASSLKQSTLPPATPPKANSPSTTTSTETSGAATPPKKVPTPTLTLSCSGIDAILSPKAVRGKVPPTPSFDSHKSPLSARAPWPSTPRTPVTTMHVKQPFLPSPLQQSRQKTNP